MSLLLRVARDAVRTTEKQLQAAIVSEVASVIKQQMRATRDDTQAVANTLASASSDPKLGMSSVQAVLASRTAIDAVRFEVPAARVNTILRQPGTTTVPPESTEDSRSLADKDGYCFVWKAPRIGSLIIPITMDNRVGSKGAKGYLSVEVNSKGMEAALGQLVESRLGREGAMLAVADSKGQVVSSYGLSPDLVQSKNARDFAAIAILPPALAWTSQVAMVSEYHDGSTAMVGAVETIPELGWVVGLWRPEHVAYASLDEMRKSGVRVGLATALLAVILGLLASRTLTKPILGLVRQSRLIGERKWREIQIDPRAKGELGELSSSLIAMAGTLERGESEIARQAKLHGDLSRYLSKEIVDSIIEGKHDLQLGGKRMQITVLFADVVAFTPLAETREAEEVVVILNELFSIITEIIFKHGGIVDKFIGDCVMAVWGSPIPSEDHAERALAAAEDIMRFLESANENWIQRYGIEVRLGVGINTGFAIVGNIGSDKRMEFTAIGDVVNVAARLEAIAAPNQVLVGEATARQARERFPLLSLGEKKLTGRSNSTEVFELSTQ